MKRASSLLLALSSLLLIASFASCSADKFPISFHLQGDKTDAKKTIVTRSFNGQEVTFQTASFISGKDIESYRIFQDGKTGTWGAGFYLKPGPKNRYYAISSESIGKYVLPVAKGKPCEIFEINAAYPHGLIFIYSGLTVEDVELIKKNYEPHEKEKERQDYNKAEKDRKVKALA